MNALESRFARPAKGAPPANLRALLGPFNAELDRADLPRLQMDLARLLGKATLGARPDGRLRVIVLSLEDLGALFGRARSHVHEALFGFFEGGSKEGVWISGIAQGRPFEGHGVLPGKRIFSVEEIRRDAGAAWLITVFPDSRLWNVSWRFERSRLDQWLGALELVAEQVTPQHPALAPCADLQDAAAVVSVEGAFRNRERVVPESGTARGAFTVHGLTALKRLNREQSNSQTVNRGVQGGTAERPLDELTEFVHEAIAMKHLELFVGAADMAAWGGDWRVNWVRKWPGPFRKALRILRGDEQTGWTAHRSRAQALKDLTLRLAGVEPREFFKESLNNQ